MFLLAGFYIFAATVLIIMGRNSIKDIRQKEIVEVFYKVAKKEGLENTSIAKIAKVMDVNPSLIVHYFNTKEELTYALVDYILDKYLLIYKVGQRSPGVHLPKALVNLIDNLFSKKWNKLFDDGLFYSCYALTFRDKRIKDMYHNLSNILRERLADFLTVCVREKVIKLKDPQLTAELLFVFIDGAYYYLSQLADKSVYEIKMNNYKKEAYRLLGVRNVRLFSEG